jgi:hypothetical protein
MKKILITLVTVTFLMATSLSFSVLAEDTSLPTISNTWNVPNGGQECQKNASECEINK